MEETNISSSFWIACARMYSRHSPHGFLELIVLLLRSPLVECRFVLVVTMVYIPRVAISRINALKRSCKEVNISKSMSRERSNSSFRETWFKIAACKDFLVCLWRELRNFIKCNLFAWISCQSFNAVYKTTLRWP